MSRAYGLQGRDYAAFLAQRRDRYRLNKSVRDDRRQRNLIQNYGITIQDYDDMVAAQRGGCAICGGPAGGSCGRFHVDHDHVTGVIRSLLCHKCNVGLGSFNDDPLRLELAAVYLREHADK